MSQYNLFNHMLYPYVTRKSRGDTLNLARGLYAINPTSIKTPLTERGNPSFKLEKIAEMNNLPVEFAHDAFSDVKTSIALTKFINEADVSNWGQLQMTMSKEDAIEYINKNCYNNNPGDVFNIRVRDDSGIPEIPSRIEGQKTLQYSTY